ncbi:hypothetical protein EYR41_006082 [Orbilia oligospora]|uniref:FAD-binding FR-type domain-containing protein n=1 Tax=Orbilia oligospora TaxID=2813651 RepID=A0A8H2E1H1_ORBOL|nr:hypothetical protein EYR41_006082 [Orbilia oligospora]
MLPSLPPQLQALPSIPLWYGIICGSIILTLFVVRVFTIVYRYFSAKIVFYFSNRLLYPIAFAQVSKRMSRWNFLLVAGYILVNVVFVAIGPNNREAWSLRASRMAMMNLFILIFGKKISVIGQVLGMKYNSYANIHYLTGYLAVIEGLLHVFLSASQVTPISKIWPDPGFRGAVCLGAIFLTGFFQNKIYEIHKIAHWILIIILIQAIWAHMAERQMIYPVLWVSVWAFTVALSTLWRLSSILRGRGLGKVCIKKFDTALQVHLKVRKPWRPSPGTYVHLTIPFLSTFSLFQSHPFAIAWWPEEVCDAESNFVFLIKPHRGVTLDLLQCSADKWYTAIVDGPYGISFPIDTYGTVFIIATGIGIAGVLPYIKNTITGYNSFDVKTQEICLIWHLEREGDGEWVEDWMNEMLQADTKYILRIELYTPTRKTSDTQRGIMKNYGQHGRLRKIYEEPNWPSIFDQCMGRKRGKTAILSITRDPFNTLDRERV